MVSVNKYIGAIGTSEIQHAALSNVTILQVTRSGATYYRSIAPSENLQFSYSPTMGLITFYTPFNGPDPSLPVTLSQLEQVSVKFKI